MSFIAIPIYIGFLGIESWGLIGFFMTIQFLLTVIDMGWSAALNNNLARLQSEGSDPETQRNMLRTIECIYWCISIVATLMIVILAPLISEFWIKNASIKETTLVNSIRLMGFIFLFHFPVALYEGALSGLQKQVRLNVILVLSSFSRVTLTITALWIVNANLETFFTFQLIAQILHTTALYFFTWGALPTSSLKTRFEANLVAKTWRFAAGVAGISIVTIALTTSDKIILSKLLNLEDFAYYMVAISVSNAMLMLINPFHRVAFPKFSSMVENSPVNKLKDFYHLLCQSMAVMVIPTCLMISLFSYELMSIWLRNTFVVENTYKLVLLITIGTGINGLLSVPYSLQLAYKWTKLSFNQNILSLALFVPILFIVCSEYGSIGAATLWMIMNLSWLLISPYFLYKKLLVGEKMHWYKNDIAYQLVISSSLIISVRILTLRIEESLLTTLIIVISTWLISVLASSLASDKIGPRVIDRFVTFMKL